MSDRPNLSEIWNWLPVFRAIAESEHLPSAAKQLHVTPAAISRTLGLLEDRLGYLLFNRSGKRLVLNGRGEVLRQAVTEAMTTVERGLRSLEENPFYGPLRVSAVGVLTNHYVLPALHSLTEAHGELEPEIQLLGTRAAAQALLRGDLDAAFIYEGMTLEGIHVEHLGHSPSSIYCGRDHPLFEADVVGLAEVLDHPFAVPHVGETGQVVDGWPADVERIIGMRIQLLTSNLEICRRGRFLTVLPDVTARPCVMAGELRRLPLDVVPTTALYAVRRTGDEGEPRARGAIEAVARRVQQIEAEMEEFRRDTG